MTTLNESDLQALHELLEAVFSKESGDDAVQEALVSLKSMIELDEPENNEGEGENEISEEDTSTRDRVKCLKQHVLDVKPNFFELLTKLPEDQDAEVDFYLASSKADIIAEMLRNFPPAKLAFVPLVDALLQSWFRHNADENPALRAQDEYTCRAVAEMLRSDPAAEGADRKMQEALSKQIQSFSDILSPNLLAGGMNLELAQRQCVLASVLCRLLLVPLKPDAVPSFIQAGGLDALLTIILRGPFSASISDLDSPNSSLEDACSALQRLIDDSSCKEIATALIERQAVLPLLEKLSHICGLEDVLSASYIPQSLVVLSKSDEILREQVISEAQKMMSSNPSDLGPGAALVLWKLLQAGEEHEIEDIENISNSKKYVPFFLAPCKPGAADDVLEAIGDALAARIGKPGEQLRKGISTPKQVDQFMVLLEYACNQSAPDISSTMQVLRELVLPTDLEDTGGFIDPEEDAKRINKPFCKAFGKAMKKRYQAAQALAPKVSGSEIVIEEPSEEGLANMKNVKMLIPIVEEQYTTIALLVEDLLDYVQYMIFNPSPLSRRAGIELIDALTHDSSLSSDFTYVPDVIDATQEAMVAALDDPRALIRVLAMQWLKKIMTYRHPRGNATSRYKPAIDFVTESVKEEKLVEMLKGTENEVTVAAEMVEAIVRHSKGPEVRARFKKNQELLEGLWNGVFWDPEKAPEDQDGDISDDAFVYGNIRPSCGDALSQILDPLADHAGIIKHVAPKIAKFKDMEAFEFNGALTDTPAVASFAIMAPETGVLSRVSEIIPGEDLPHAMSIIRHLARGVTLAKVTLGQSDDIYPALVKVLQEGEDLYKEIVVDDLEFLLSGSTVSKTKFLKSGGMKPLLGFISSEDRNVSRKATYALTALVAGFPEGAKEAIEAGAISALEAKEDPNDMLRRVSSALDLLKELKDAPSIDRIEFTPEAYAAFGKTLSEPGAMDRLTQNLKSSGDEKELAIAGGLLTVFADMLRSGSDPMPVLEALYTIYVADGVLVNGLNPPAIAGQACGLPDALRPLMESEDDKIKEYATRIRSAILMEQDDGLEGEGGKEQDENQNEAEPEENVD
ncbi:DNA mismatch repair protein MutS [Ceratobasidium sp. AG-Ba]|nr:DNA mismatch repair protein MutS [Ceratobasidium sp. AG-Ba]